MEAQHVHRGRLLDHVHARGELTGRVHLAFQAQDDAIVITL